MTNRSLTLSLRVALVSVLLAMASGVAGCRASQPTPTPQPTATAKPTATPRPTASPTPGALELVVLHTNDALSYTEPCG